MRRYVLTWSWDPHFKMDTLINAGRSIYTQETDAATDPTHYYTLLPHLPSSPLRYFNKSYIMKVKIVNSDIC